MSVIDTATCTWNGYGYGYGPAFPVVVPGGGPGSPLAPNVPAARRRPDLTSERVIVGHGYGNRNSGNVPLALPPSIDDVTKVTTHGHYEWMMTDPVVSASVRALKLAILAGGMDLKATVSAKPGAKQMSAEEQRAKDMVEFCWRAVERCEGWNALLMGLLDASWGGYKLAEKVFEVAEGGPDDGKLLWSRIRCKPRDAYRLAVDPALNVVGAVFRSGAAGTYDAFLPREKFVLMSWDPADGDPRGTSVLRPAVEPCNLKRLTWPELYRHLQQFGSAMLIGETAPGEPDHPGVDEHGVEVSGDPAMNAQKRMGVGVQALRNGGWMVHAAGGKVYTIPPQGNGEAFHSAVDLFNREIVQAILLQTRATTEAQHGSKADSETGQDIFGLRVDAGRQTLGATLREDGFRHLIALNFGEDVADEFTPLVTFGTKEEDKSSQWSAAASMGYQLGASQLEEVDSMLGLPIRDAAADEAKAKQKAEEILAQKQAMAPAEKGPPEPEPKEDRP